MGRSSRIVNPGGSDRRARASLVQPATAHPGARSFKFPRHVPTDRSRQSPRANLPGRSCRNAQEESSSAPPSRWPACSGMNCVRPPRLVYRRPGGRRTNENRRPIRPPGPSAVTHQRRRLRRRPPKRQPLLGSCCRRDRSIRPMAEPTADGGRPRLPADFLSGSGRVPGGS